MKKLFLLVSVCVVLVIGGIITTYFYANMQDPLIYKNGLFVSRGVTCIYG